MVDWTSSNQKQQVQFELILSSAMWLWGWITPDSVIFRCADVPHSWLWQECCLCPFSQRYTFVHCWNLWDLDSLCTSFPKTQPDWKEHTEITMLHSKCVSLLDLGTSDLHSAVSWHVHTGEPKAWIDPISHVSNNDFQNLFSSSVQNCVDTLFKFCFQIAWAFVISSWYPLRCQPLHFNTVCSALPFDSYILCLVCSIQTYWWEVFPTT